MEIYEHPSEKLPILGTYDLLVCGGGPAGCAAALAAARRGVKTLLIEREGYLGGAPCTQSVVPILSTNAVDFQGVWHEWANTLKKYDGISELHQEDRCGTTWYAGSTDPEMIKLVWDKLLSEAGVKILHFAQAAGAIVEDKVIKGAILQCKPGRVAIFAKRVIDCTGDGDLCAYAGCEFDHGTAGTPWGMGVSLNSWYGNVPQAEDYEPGWGNPVGGRSLGKTKLFQAGMLRMLKIDPLNPWNLTQVMREGREQIWERLQTKKEDPKFKDIFLAGTASLPGVRSSRRIKGIKTSTADDAINLRKYSDGIARSSWEVDIHSAINPTKKPIMGDPSYIDRIRKTETGDYYDIPYGCIVADGVDNLLMAGRCVSADHESQASLRIQQTCMSLGQAAGTAAAMSLETDSSQQNLNVAKLIKQLNTDRESIKPAFKFQ